MPFSNANCYGEQVLMHWGSIRRWRKACPVRSLILIEGMCILLKDKKRKIIKFTSILLSLTDESGSQKRQYFYGGLIVFLRSSDLAGENEQMTVLKLRQKAPEVYWAVKATKKPWSLTAFFIDLYEVLELSKDWILSLYKFCKLCFRDLTEISPQKGNNREPFSYSLP